MTFGKPMIDALNIFDIDPKHWPAMPMAANRTSWHHKIKQYEYQYEYENPRYLYFLRPVCFKIVSETDTSTNYIHREICISMYLVAIDPTPGCSG